MYKVKESDLIWDIEGFPIEVVQWMVEQQVKQGNKANVTVFQVRKDAGFHLGGFTWSSYGDSDFCYEVIKHKNFDLFFEKFPKKTDINQLYEELMSKKTSKNQINVVEDLLTPIYEQGKKDALTVENCIKFLSEKLGCNI